MPQNSEKYLSRNEKYIHSPEFDDPQFEPVRPIRVSRTPFSVECPREYLMQREVYRLLDERNAFLTYNWDRKNLIEQGDLSNSLCPYHQLVLADEDVIVRSNVGLLFSKVNPLTNSDYYGPFTDDFISLGLDFLLQSVRYFDVNRGNAFSTLAGSSIDNSIRRVKKAIRKNQILYYDPLGDDNTAPLYDLPFIDHPVSHRSFGNTSSQSEFDLLERLPDALYEMEQREGGERMATVVNHRYGIYGGELLSHDAIASLLGFSARDSSRNWDAKALQTLRELLGVKPSEVL